MQPIKEIPKIGLAEPDATLIESLENLLEMAKEGELRGVFYVAFTAGRTTLHQTVGSTDALTTVGLCALALHDAAANRIVLD